MEFIQNFFNQGSLVCLRKRNSGFSIDADGFSEVFSGKVVKKYSGLLPLEFWPREGPCTPAVALALSVSTHLCFNPLGLVGNLRNKYPKVIADVFMPAGFSVDVGEEVSVLCGMFSQEDIQNEAFDALKMAIHDAYIASGYKLCLWVLRLPSQEAVFFTQPCEDGRRSAWQNAINSVRQSLMGIILRDFSVAYGSSCNQNGTYQTSSVLTLPESPKGHK